MKYILVAHYAGFDMDDPEDLTNNAWLVGETDSKEEAEKLAAKEIDDFIARQIEGRFDEDPDDLEGAEKLELLEEIKSFTEEFETSITSIRIPSDKTETIARLYHDAGGYYEDLKVEVIKVGE